MRKSKILIVLVVMLITMLSASTMVFAAGIFDGKYEESKAGEYLGAICKLDSSGAIVLAAQITAITRGSTGTETLVIKVGAATQTLTVTPDAKAKLIELSRQIYDKESLKSKVNSIGENFDVEADTEGAGVMLVGIQPLVSLVVGLLAYAVVIGMSLFTALDIVYITMPVFRNKVEEMKQSGNGIMVKSDRKTGEAKLRWVTDEAQHAVMMCGIDTGKNPLGMYFKKRIFAYVLVAIVIYILLTGNIQLIVNIAINFVSGVLDALSSLGK